MSTHMFDNYTNITGQPDNMHPVEIPKEFVVDINTVEPLYDKFNNQIGFKWKYGTSIKLTLTVNIDIKVRSNSIISKNSGEVPTTETVGEVGARYYNSIDIKSWYLESYSESSGYNWVEDGKLTYFSDGTVNLTLTPSTVGKQTEVGLYNFRGEEVDLRDYEGNTFVWVLTPEQSAKIQKGIYKLKVYLESLDENIIIEDNKTRRLVNSYELYVN